jgi:hypothetical protein
MTAMAKRLSHGKAKKAKKPAKPLKTCGAAGRMCLCGHHRKQHAGKTGRCWDCQQEGKTCEVFKAKPCASTRLMKNGRCQMHGGKQPSGIASPNWKTGRWAASIKHLGLRNSFYAALEDPTLERTEQDVAILDALLNNALGSVGTSKTLTEGQERRIGNLTERRQQALERKARIERHLGLWIHHTRYQQVMMGMVNILHDEIKTADGKPDTAVLGRIQKRIEALMMGLAVGQATAESEADATE